MAETRKTEKKIPDIGVDFAELEDRAQGNAAALVEIEARKEARDRALLEMLNIIYGDEKQADKKYNPQDAGENLVTNDNSISQREFQRQGGQFKPFNGSRITRAANAEADPSKPMQVVLVGPDHNGVYNKSIQDILANNPNAVVINASNLPPEKVKELIQEATGGRQYEAHLFFHGKAQPDDRVAGEIVIGKTSGGRGITAAYKDYIPAIFKDDPNVGRIVNASCEGGSITDPINGVKASDLPAGVVAMALVSEKTMGYGDRDQRYGYEGHRGGFTADDVMAGVMANIDRAKFAGFNDWLTKQDPRTRGIATTNASEVLAANMVIGGLGTINIKDTVNGGLANITSNPDHKYDRATLLESVRARLGDRRVAEIERGLPGHNLDGFLTKLENGELRFEDLQGKQRDTAQLFVLQAGMLVGDKMRGVTSQDPATIKAVPDHASPPVPTGRRAQKSMLPDEAMLGGKGISLDQAAVNPASDFSSQVVAVAADLHQDKVQQQGIV